MYQVCNKVLLRSDSYCCRLRLKTWVSRGAKVTRKLGGGSGTNILSLFLHKREPYIRIQTRKKGKSAPGCHPFEILPLYCVVMVREGGGGEGSTFLPSHPARVPGPPNNAFPAILERGDRIEQLLR